MNRLEEGKHTQAMRAAGAALAGTGIMRGAQFRRMMVRQRAAHSTISTMRSMRTVRLTASGYHGECRRQWCEDHARHQQERQRTFYDE